MKNGSIYKVFDSLYPYSINMSNTAEFGLHWHNYIELFYVKKGTLRLTTGDFSFQLDEGHICFVDSGTIHCMNQTDMENEILILQISTETSSSFHTIKNYKFNSAAYLSDLSNDTVPLRELQQIINNIYNENLVKAVGYQNIILGYINTLIGLLIRSYYLIPKEETDYTSKSSLDRLATIIEYLEEHYKEKITLEKLASDLHMNYYYLSHFFKDTAGVSFQEYINTLRVNKSLSLLAETKNNITRIALDIGFANIKSYTKAFKSKFGFLPSEYKKNLIREFSTEYLDNEKVVDQFEEQAKEYIYSRNAIKDFISMNERFQKNDKSKHTLSENYEIYESKSTTTLIKNNELLIDLDLFYSLDISLLRKICDSYFIQAITLCTGSISNNYAPQAIEQYMSMINCEEYSITQKDLHAFTEYKNLEIFSLLPAITTISDFLDKQDTPCIPVLAKCNSLTLCPPFYNSSTLFTSFKVPTPLYYAYSYLHQLRGEIIFSSSSSIITKYKNKYRILCCHNKSLEMYRSLTKHSEFDVGNYFFFISSFPHEKMTFTLTNIKTKVKQTSMLVSNDTGCILNEWIKVGSPEFLTNEVSSYLEDITKPKLSIKKLPFRESPIVTIELPPLGFSYVEIEF